MSMFTRWCQLRGVSHLPAVPSVVAKFVEESALSPALLQAELTEIDDAHEELNYAPPGKARVVNDAVHRLHSIAPPRSWAKEELPLFRGLPYFVAQIIVRRETERDKALSRALNEAAELRKKRESNDNKTAA